MSRIVATIAIAALLNSCGGGSRPPTEEYMEVVRERITEQASVLADQIDTYAFDSGFNLGWDYLDSTGNRTMALAGILTITCIEAYETGDVDSAMAALDRELQSSIRDQNDVLAIVFIPQYALDNLCYDYDTFGSS